MQIEQDRLISLMEAATLLQELHICKAFGPTGRVNGPNCQRFGRRDGKSGRWEWSVVELIREAERRGCATAAEIQNAIARYSISPQDRPVVRTSKHRSTRAQVEK